MQIYRSGGELYGKLDRQRDIQHTGRMEAAKQMIPAEIGFVLLDEIVLPCDMTALNIDDVVSFLLTHKLR